MVVQKTRRYVPRCLGVPDGVSHTTMFASREAGGAVLIVRCYWLVVSGSDDCLSTQAFQRIGAVLPVRCFWVVASGSDDCLSTQAFQRNDAVLKPWVIVGVYYILIADIFLMTIATPHGRRPRNICVGRTKTPRAVCAFAEFPGHSHCPEDEQTPVP